MVVKRSASEPEPEDLISVEEGWKILDEQARAALGMSGEEFVRAWNAGEIKDPDRPEVMHVVMLLPLAR